ncbi:hypothetical protein Belba_3170 [Belliella baltica DSM 15883]|uniref:Glycosyl hydrolase-like 10 domain-containing protein n=1 Tax=Belliella baltica (strain DSM 15883 / CIP 108006 / LMG 21964 / BA134) TaxID=866536 RepID=I3Z8W4_BELBD|nr:family 10 glycosylhydrolase [Belliella baltica]AFL85682.1 hypothetical protein Belba_3170 [Belliella baltica DSM 15883]
MYSRYSNFLLLSAIFTIATSCSTSKKIVSQPSPNPSIKITSPQPENISLPESKKAENFYTLSEITLNQEKREFRGVWIATVANIDWPKSGSDNWEKQKSDFIAILDYYEQLNFNAIILQVRAAGDAFYPSKYAPWSKYLTGQEGTKPNTEEDPLSWMILQTHLRGMEFHAWFNPYRATFDLNTDKLSPNHDFFKHPDWMVKYGTKYYYNPGIPEVKEKLTNIINEVVLNYDIDAIHFDDYFYPYKLEKQIFQDEHTFRKYRQNGQQLEDWRRQNVNNLVEAVSQTIKSNKPWVQFGISPFGVWRNIDKDRKGSNTKAGVTNYDELYADPLTWMKNKWIDYLIPQIYWSMDFNLAAHRELVSWWAKTSFDTKIYVGNSAYKIRDNFDVAWNDPNEIGKQVAYAKSVQGIQGNAFFSAQSLYSKNRDVASELKNKHYQTKILSPKFEPSINPVSLKNTQVELVKIGGDLQLFFPNSIDPMFRFAMIYSGSDIDQIKNKSQIANFQKIFLNERTKNSITLQSTAATSKYIVISFLDRYGRETVAKVFEMKQ